MQARSEATSARTGHWWLRPSVEQQQAGAVERPPMVHKLWLALHWAKKEGAL